MQMIRYHSLNHADLKTIQNSLNSSMDSFKFFNFPQFSRWMAPEVAKATGPAFPRQGLWVGPVSTNSKQLRYPNRRDLGETSERGETHMFENRSGFRNWCHGKSEHQNCFGRPSGRSCRARPVAAGTSVGGHGPVTGSPSPSTSQAQADCVLQTAKQLALSRLRRKLLCSFFWELGSSLSTKHEGNLDGIPINLFWQTRNRIVFSYSVNWFSDSR